METNLVKKGLHGIYGGLQMLSETKTEHLSALAEISIILGNPIVIERYELSEEANKFLSTIHFLIKDIDAESVKTITSYINSIQFDENSTPNNVDYKVKYEALLTKSIIAQEEILRLQNLTSKS